MKNRYKYIDEKGEHMHTLDGSPLIGTSSVADVLSKPLAYWASGHAVKTLGVVEPKSLTKIKNKKASEQELATEVLSVEAKLAEIKGMTTDEYLALLIKAYGAHATSLKDKAKDGTDLHAELERFINDEMSVGVSIHEGKAVTEYHPRIHPLIKWSRENVKRHLWSEVNCYSEKMWTGGISDWGVELKECVLNDIKLPEGTIAVVDFKSSPKAYLSQFWQACGYAMQIEENGGFDADGNQVFKFAEGERVSAVIIVPFGMEEPTPQVNIDIAGGNEAFKAELVLYKKLPKE